MRFLVSMTESMHDELKQISRRRGQTLSGLVREIVWQWLREEKEARQQ